MLDVLVDMEVFAERNQMPGSAQCLRNAHGVVGREISAMVLKRAPRSVILADVDTTEDADRLIHVISRDDPFS